MLYLYKIYFTHTEKDSYVPEEETNKNKIIWGIIIAIIIIFLLIAISQGNTYAAYSDAMNEFNNGNYETALMLFEDLPSNYKDVSYMIDESKYQTAMGYLQSGDFSSAESLFESISYHNDSADKLNECKYQSAYSLFNSGSYAEAKNIFNEDDKDGPYVYVGTYEFYEGLFVHDYSLYVDADAVYVPHGYKEYVTTRIN